MCHGPRTSFPGVSCKRLIGTVSSVCAITVRFLRAVVVVHNSFYVSVDMKLFSGRRLGRELKKGSAELLILSLLEARARHGYEIGRLIDERSGGRIQFKAASLYPCSTASKSAAGLPGAGVERPASGAAGFYRLTADGANCPQGATHLLAVSLWKRWALSPGPSTPETGRGVSCRDFQTRPDRR